jgi:hypothetical protein
MQKRQIPEKDLPLLKNDITGSESVSKIKLLQIHVFGTFKKCALELIF